MTLSLASRLRALFREGDEPSLELVITANLYAAAALGVVTVFKFDGSAGMFFATVAGVFVVLTTCLLSRYTVWIAAILGSLTMTLAPAALLAAAADALLGQVWAGALLGALFGVGFGIRVYWRLTKKVLRGSTDPRATSRSPR